MTAVRDRKSKLQFETDETVRGREVVIEVTPRIAYVRLKGTRTRFEISWTTVYEQACRIAAERARRERQEQRRLKGRR